MDVGLIDRINYIEKESFNVVWKKEIYMEMKKNPLYDIFTIYEGDLLVGFAVTTIALDEAEIIRVAVDKSYRNKGYGRNLICNIISNLKIKNITKIFLEVRESNVSAISLYKKAGFYEINIRKNYYPDNLENAIIMQLEL
ncbi:MAG: ribosomal protein S18-alanine N-acetyltransferase [Fusobacteria bacterium]|nr:ribosomal protein S18-alanine N-acetyltransferase [Fusobacteriota bacterium]